MKKISMIYILAFLMPLITFSQKSDLDKWNLKGKIKTIKETFYKIEKDNATVMSHCFTNEFNDFGNRTVDTKHLPNGENRQILQLQL
ncbi:MAG: hypothetical protein IPF66_25100 [Holophagales bacterium]|nr:hypothetical protein [Holophagales bacterium]